MINKINNVGYGLRIAVAIFLMFIASFFKILCVSVAPKDQKQQFKDLI